MPTNSSSGSWDSTCQQNTSLINSILPKIQLDTFPGKIGGVTLVSLKTQSFLDRTYMCILISTINTHKHTHKITREEFIRGSANTAYIHRAHQIYSLYHTQCISYTLRKIYTQCFCSLSKKYYTCIFCALFLRTLLLLLSTSCCVLCV
jgi:hypothetical protein